MSTNVVPTKATSVARVDMKVEVVVIPVSDVERAKEFYQRLGWRVDVTPPGSGIVQLTPHGSSCSVQFGKNLTSAAPGSAKSYLIVSDIEDAPEQAGRRRHRGERDLPPRPEAARSVVRILSMAPTARSPRSAIPTATSGCCRRSRPGFRAHRHRRDFVRLRKRPGERASACGGRTRRARKAHRQCDPNWPDWYAEYMAAEQDGTELPT